MLCWDDGLHTLNHQPYDRFQRDFLLFKGTVPFGRLLLPFNGRNRPLKQQKVPLEPVVGLMVEGVKTVIPAKHGSGKGLMKAPSTSQEKPPLLLHDDSKYALEKLSSIIT